MLAVCSIEAVSAICTVPGILNTLGTAHAHSITACSIKPGFATCFTHTRILCASIVQTTTAAIEIASFSVKAILTFSTGACGAIASAVLAR